MPHHWHKNSIQTLIKRDTYVLLTPIIALSICQAVSRSRSEIVRAAMGCLHNKTSSQWIKNKTHSCSCTCRSSSLPSGLRGAAHAGAQWHEKSVLHLRCAPGKGRKPYERKCISSLFLSSLLSPDLDHPRGRTNGVSQDCWPLFSFSLCHLYVSPLLFCLDTIILFYPLLHYQTLLRRLEARQLQL